MPDNPKVAVIKACFYDSQVNRTYAGLAEHYDTAILPAHPRKPRDTANVEGCVRILGRWLLEGLRHRRFYSLAEVNAAVAELLMRLTTSGCSATSAAPAASCSRRQTSPG